MCRIFNLYGRWILFLCVGLVGCQQLQVPVAPKKDASNINWKGITIQREDLPISTTLDNNVEANAIELNPTRSTTTPQSDEPAITVAPKHLDPQLFLGQPPEQLQNNLGAPSILRKEGDIEIWQYQFSNCVVEFFFYDKAGTMAATHTDMRSPFLGGKLDQAACKHALYKISR